MLTSEQAKINQEKYGYNELAEGKRKSTARIFLEQFEDFLVIILIIAAIVSGFLGDAESAVVIFVVITINAILGTVQTVKAEQSLKSLKQLSAPEAKVIRDGVMVQIPSREVTVGDEVILEAGDCVPADGQLLDVASLKADESALTGESLSVEKSLEEAPAGAALGDQTNRVFSGSFVTYGRGTFEVTSIGMETEVGKIARLLKTTSEKKTPLQMNLDDFGKKLSIIILVFCGILFAVNVVRGGSVADAFLFAVALAVAAIPEALSSIVTIVLSFGTQKMAREHAIIRKLQAVEGLGSVSVICSDKTGTLTQNKMTVEDYYVDGRRIPAGDIDLSVCNEEKLLIFSMLCNDSVNAEGQEIGDPTETALINVGSRLGADASEIRKRFPRKSEIPFDSDRKLMSTQHRIDGAEIIVVKGAVDVLLGRMSSIRTGEAVRDITEDDRLEIERQNMEFSRDGLRVLAFAYKEIESARALTLEDEDGLIFLGLISMMDPPREESKAAVSECKAAGIKPVMITGDHKVTAAAIARKIGILEDDSEACEGAVIEDMSDEELQDFVEKISVYARVSPEHKIRIVRAWQDKGNIVAMTGDGVNDAPALKQADIGVAMGITGSEVSKDAASMVLTDDNFATIIKAVENGRNIYQNIKNSIQFLLSGNFGAILAVLYASVAGLPVPFAPVHLLFINLLTDSLPAIALGLEPHTQNVMQEKPRPMDESILTGKYLLSIGTEGLCIGVMTMAAFYIGYVSGGSALASTMAFGTLCTGRLVHGFNCKSKGPVLFTNRFFNNIYLIGAFVIGLLLITGVLMIPGLHGIFKVVTLDLGQLLTVYGLALLNLPVIQLMKKIRS
ncbi:cation-transporting ATPase, P-type [Lachnospiraceae bacterium]|uniref:cation-translocating P-type ATPase n=1 Tax=Extibacter sp. GGCC_0201 TaxID=2731209 RepID=UPI001AA113BD|nr:cation-translocating P-type ATPase [Extibacter sp. GGCC_0201]MBO1720963.1 cation-translocating P-type ATPase [Extibacter sp. GGCC_0201]BDF31977.1 cation-transporting ATPase, P-type [Lachnospiraceae bacterium]BDF35990.1 cation-transporting ATPase, P-type [Lachnospiraceae bacterium]